MQAQATGTWKRSAAWAALVLVLLLLLWRRNRPAPRPPGPVAAVAVPVVPRAPAPGPRPTAGGRLDARHIDAAKARKLLARALRRLVEAPSYKEVMTTSTFSGNGEIKFYASFTLQHLRSPTRGDLFRCDTLNFSGPASDFTPETMKLEPAVSRTEITNEDGNWDMGDGMGKEGIAFHLTGPEVPLETVAMHRSFQSDAAELEDEGVEPSLAAANGSDGATPVLAITRTRTYPGGTSSKVYMLDPATGDLLATAEGGIRMDFSLTAPIDEGEFAVPSSRVVAPVADQEALQRYIAEHR